MPASLLEHYLGDYFDGLIVDLAMHPASPALPRLRVCDTGDAYVLTLPALGVHPEDVTVRMREGLVTIRAPGLYRTVYLSEPVDPAPHIGTRAGGFLTVTFTRR